MSDLKIKLEHRPAQSDGGQCFVETHTDPIDAVVLYLPFGMWEAGGCPSGLEIEIVNVFGAYSESTKEA